MAKQTANEAHKTATKILIERVKEKLNLGLIEDVFDFCCLNARKTTSEADDAFLFYEKHGLVPAWIFNVLLDVMAGRLDLKGASTAKA